MTIVRIDFRFVDLERELQIQGDYITMLATHMPNIVEAERQRLHELYKDSPPEERGGLDFLEADLDSGVVTRSFGLASIVSVWALYETSVAAVADVGRKKRRVKLRMDDLKGAFLERARRYYSDVLRFQLHTHDRDAAPLHDLAQVRHIYAHTSGKLNHLGPDKLRLIQGLVARNVGLTIVDRVLIARIEAAQRFHALVEGLLIDLFDRARREF